MRLLGVGYSLVGSFYQGKSRGTTETDLKLLRTNGIKLSPLASGIRCILIRPNLSGACTLSAIKTMALFPTFRPLLLP